MVSGRFMSTDRTLSLHVPRYAVWLLAGLLLAPWLLVGAWIVVIPRGPAAEREHPAAGVTTQADATGAIGEVARGNPGPWGTLEYTRILLEPPEEFIPVAQPAAQPPAWVFKGYSEAMVDRVLDSAELSPQQRSFFARPEHREMQADRIILRPTAPVVLGLSSRSRATLYNTLAAFPENFAQYNPYRLRSSVAADWFEDSGLPHEAVQLTKSLLYSRGTATCFSDYDLVLPSLTPEQRVKYIKTLARKSGLLLKLKVAAGQNIEPLVEYWGRGVRRKDLRPLLQSLARNPRGGSIDVVHLLPRFARLLVYTYPFPSERPLDAAHDCHWTSFNFGNETPDERLSDIEHVKQVLLDRYYPVLGPPMLGDIVMFVRQDGIVAHSCVYIADDIVFSKNGPAFSVPWLMTTLADVEAFYGATPGTEIRRYRPKGL